MSSQPQTAVAPVRTSRVPAVLYFVLAAAGLIGTWYFNLQYTGGNYIGDWFANDASSSAAVDIIVIAVVACGYFVWEGRRLQWRLPLVLLFIPLSFVVAVSFSLPLFLGLRELSLLRRQRG